LRVALGSGFRFLTSSTQALIS